MVAETIVQHQVAAQAVAVEKACSGGEALRCLVQQEGNVVQQNLKSGRMAARPARTAVPAQVKRQ
jgi:hypothetical protein